MLKGTTASPFLDKQYDGLKAKIVDYMHGKLNPEGYKTLLGELSPSQLRLNKRNHVTILWWVVYASFFRNPKLFVDVWNAHNRQLVHADFSAIQGTCGSPLWYLAAMSNADPKFITAYFNRFARYIKIDTLTEVISVNNDYNASIFGLLAHSAASFPREFEEIWSMIKDDLSETVLTRQETISGIVKSPLSSILYATLTSDITTKSNQEKLHCRIIHFCFEQFGDLRPGLPSGYRLPGAIIRKETDDTVKAFDLASLQRSKDAFFDELNRIKAYPNPSYSQIIQLGRAALNAGYLNSGFQLAQHFRELNRSDYVYEALTVIPNGSIYQQNSLKKCVEWYLSKTIIESDNDKRLKYLTKTIGSCLKISSEPLRVGFLKRIAYFYIYGKEMPANESDAMNYAFLMKANDKTSIKAVLYALAQCKRILFTPTPVENIEQQALLASLDGNHNNESVHEQPLPKPVIPSMTPNDGYKQDPIPSLFSLIAIDHESYQVSMPVSAQSFMSIDEHEELDDLSSLMDTSDAMLLMNTAVPYVKAKTANNKPAPMIVTITTPDYALPLAPELSDIDPLRKFYKR